jgi:hypothetical protein
LFRVTDKGGKPIPGATVTSPYQNRTSGVADSLGQVAFSNLQVGKWWIVIQARGYREFDGSMEFSEGKPESLVVQLEVLQRNPPCDHVKGVYR